MNRARRIVEAASADSHQIRGFLSYERGFLPLENPATTLPPEYAAWDEIAGCLPQHYHDLTLRQAVAAMPPLPAESLPERYLHRATALISMLAHAYVRVQPGDAPPLPPQIAQPWRILSQRVARPAPLLSYIDIIMVNWRLRDPNGAITVENMDLLFPTVGNEAERIFYLTQLEMAAVFTPAVSAMLNAQEAAAQGDFARLEAELISIIACLRQISEVTFQKIDMNPFSASYVDPVLWGKTVAPFAVPITPNVPGPSGTATPVSHAMDAFLGRSQYNSTLGTEANHLADVFPPVWREFMTALRAFSVRDAIEQSGDAHLKGIYDAVLEAFAGDKGFLGVHRLKVLGFLELAFKVGRIVTVGNFAGQFKDRMWQQVDRELGAARDERYFQLPQHTYIARVSSKSLIDGDVTRIQLDAPGLVYRSGDRAGILPENSPELVARTLQALNAAPDTPVKLSPAWRQAVGLRDGHEDDGVLSLERVLAYAKIRPLLRTTAKKLFELTSAHALREIINTRSEDQWELWDMLDLLKQAGFDVRRLWRAEPWEQEHICHLLPPETFRMYSISSAPDTQPNTLTLTAANLNYQSIDDVPYSYQRDRQGTASHYLKRLAIEGIGQPVTLRIVPALNFHLPDDPACPILMFAAGTGVAPFMGFLAERQNSGENWLFYGTRTPETLMYGYEFAQYVQQGTLNLHIAFSASEHRLLGCQDSSLFFIPGAMCYVNDLMLEPGHAETIWRLIHEERTYVYVCGSTHFAVAVREALEQIIRQHTEDATRFFYQMVAKRRYKQDIFTTYIRPARQVPLMFDVSDLVERNSPEYGIWLAIRGKVYDVTDFLYMHAGGNKIILSNAGMDATEAYQSVMHDVNPEVDSMLGMYEIGVLRRLDFHNQTGVAISKHGLTVVSIIGVFRAWTRYLYMIVEIQNALRNDYSFSDLPLTSGDDPAVLSPMRVQMMMEAHRRFVNHYVDHIMGDDLQHLWAISTGIFAPHEHIQGLAGQISTLQHEYQGVYPASDALLDLLHSDLPLESLHALCERLVALDGAFIAELKSSLREAVIAFEQYEANITQYGGGIIMGSLRRMPSILARYYAALIETMPHFVANTGRITETSEHRLIYTPGHGGRTFREENA